MLSLINYVFLFGVIPLDLGNTVSSLGTTELGAIILGGPIALALLRAIGHRHRLLGRMLARLPLLRDLSSPVDPIPAAWDWKFSRQREACWAVVRLAEGSQVAGYFGKASFSSSDPAERDLYLESVYTIDPSNNAWSETDRSDGILIKGAEIRSMEFFKLEGHDEEKPR